MSGFAIAAVGVAWFGIFCVLAWQAIDQDRPLLLLSLIAVWLVITFGFVINTIQAEDDQGPCLQEKTDVMYDPATKTARPYTHCVDRGTWVSR